MQTILKKNVTFFLFFIYFLFPGKNHSIREAIVKHFWKNMYQNILLHDKHCIKQEQLKNINLYRFDKWNNE